MITERITTELGCRKGRRWIRCSWKKKHWLYLWPKILKIGIYWCSNCSWYWALIFHCIDDQSHHYLLPNRWDKIRVHMYAHLRPAKFLSVEERRRDKTRNMFTLQNTFMKIYMHYRNKSSRTYLSISNSWVKWTLQSLQYWAYISL